MNAISTVPKTSIRDDGSDNVSDDSGPKEEEDHGQFKWRSQLESSSMTSSSSITRGLTLVDYCYGYQMTLILERMKKSDLLALARTCRKLAREAMKMKYWPNQLQVVQLRNEASVFNQLRYLSSQRRLLMRHLDLSRFGPSLVFRGDVAVGRFKDFDPLISIESNLFGVTSALAPLIQLNAHKIQEMTIRTDWSDRKQSEYLFALINPLKNLRILTWELLGIGEDFGRWSLFQHLSSQQHPQLESVNICWIDGPPNPLPLFYNFYQSLHQHFPHMRVQPIEGVISPPPMALWDPLEDSTQLEQSTFPKECVACKTMMNETALGTSCTSTNSSSTCHLNLYLSVRRTIKPPPPPGPQSVRAVDNRTARESYYGYYSRHRPRSSTPPDMYAFNHTF